MRSFIETMKARLCMQTPKTTCLFSVVGNNRTMHCSGGCLENKCVSALSRDKEKGGETRGEEGGNIPTGVLVEMASEAKLCKHTFLRDQCRTNDTAKEGDEMIHSY